MQAKQDQKAPFIQPSIMGRTGLGVEAESPDASLTVSSIRKKKREKFRPSTDNSLPYGGDADFTIAPDQCRFIAIRHFMCKLRIFSKQMKCLLRDTKFRLILFDLVSSYYFPYVLRNLFLSSVQEGNEGKRGR